MAKRAKPSQDRSGDIDDDSGISRPLALGFRRSIALSGSDGDLGRA